MSEEKPSFSMEKVVDMLFPVLLAAVAWLLGEIHREALVIAYSNQYVLLTIMPLLLLPLVWLTVMPRGDRSVNTRPAERTSDLPPH